MYRSLLISLLTLFFAAGTVSAGYHVCADAAPATQEESAVEMAGMDCASMNIQQPKKAEKTCCMDYSCLKCFSSPLMAPPQVQAMSVSAASAMIAYDDAPLSHVGGPLERPPKRA